MANNLPKAPYTVLTTFLDFTSALVDNFFAVLVPTLGGKK